MQDFLPALSERLSKSYEVLNNPGIPPIFPAVGWGGAKNCKEKPLAAVQIVSRKSLFLCILQENVPCLQEIGKKKAVFLAVLHQNVNSAFFRGKRPENLPEAAKPSVPVPIATEHWRVSVVSPAC